jgi:hypothetical protein
MKQSILLTLVVACIATSCQVQHAGLSAATDNQGQDTTIIQSLFNDKSSSISEDNIQKILNGTYRLPAKLRIAIVRLENPRQERELWNDETYLKNQASYLDSFAVRLRSSPRVTAVETIPDIIISKAPTFTTIREAAVRMQCDMVLIYNMKGDLYSKYKFFAKADIKAFATTEVLFMDVRTGLIPFSTIVTRDVMSRKLDSDMDYSQTHDRILNQAGLATVNEAGKKITDFLLSRQGDVVDASPAKAPGN